MISADGLLVQRTGTPSIPLGSSFRRAERDARTDRRAGHLRRTPGFNPAAFAKEIVQ